VAVQLCLLQAVLKKKRRNRGGCASQGDPLLHSIEAALHTQVIHKMESCKHDLIDEVHRLGKLAMVVDSLRLYVPSIVLLSISPRHLYNRRHNVSFASIKYTLTSKIFQPSSTFDLLVRYYGQTSGAESACS
jgi:hypothetical protein